MAYRPQVIELVVCYTSQVRTLPGHCERAMHLVAAQLLNSEYLISN
jgi:hypothetical protein